MLKNIKDLCNDNKIDNAIDMLFNEIDSLFTKDDFNSVDEYLFSIKLDEYPIDILISFLAITWAARFKLRRRDLFRERIEFELRRRNIPSNDIESLISGL